MSKIIDIKDGDSILVSRTDKLGDLILALPFIETLKNSYPESKIDVLASLYASPILENNNHINKILRVQNDQLMANKLYKKDLLQKVKMGKYKAVVALFPERQISSLFYKAEIPVRIGTAGRFHSVFFNTRLLHSRKKNIKHECNYNLDFMKFFKKGEVSTLPKVNLVPHEIENAKKILKDVGVDKDFVVLHPGSGGSAESWAFDNFIKLYELLEKKGMVIVASGSEEEGKSISDASGHLDFHIKKITGETDLRTLAAVLSLAKVVVANSTGPLHLAVAVGTRVVGLYPSKKAMSPVRWGPLGKDDIVMQPEGVECQCPPKNCSCMNLIKPETVAKEVLKIIKKS
jgi:ADP-heptose:LPS heptosyltransferase